MIRSAAHARTALLCSLVLAFVACGDDDGSEPSGTSGRDGGAANDDNAGSTGHSAQGSGTMTALVDDAEWTAAATSVCARTDQDVPGGYTIEGVDSPSLSARKLVLSLYNIEAPGTYSFGVGASVVGGYASYSLTDGSLWHTAYTGDQGTLTITTLTAKRIAGEFELMLSAFPGTKAKGTHAVTEGKFDVAIEGDARPIEAGEGRVVSAELDGEVFNAATVVVTPLVDGFSFNALNDNFNIGFLFSDVPEAGSYDVSLEPPTRSVVVLAGTSKDQWGANPADTGSVTLTTLSADRFVGTFELTLQPKASNAASKPMVFKSGSFDIGRRDP